MITWHPFTERTTFGYAPRPDCNATDCAKVTVAVIRQDSGGGWYWSLCAYNVEGVETTLEEAERKAEAAYRHARGLLGGVRT